MAIIASSIAINTMPAEANLKPRTSVPTLAILDTALDTSIPSIKSKLVAEVCILDWPSCPNGKSFMEGAGSSVIPMNILSTPNFNHGTQMASVAIANNPNLNIVFVRIFGHTAKGQRQTTGINTLVNALNWVKQNKDKYNIVAVSASQGATAPVINKSATSNYCSPTALDSVVSSLDSIGVPVFFPSGNSGANPKMNGKIEWPACISQSIAVGGIESGPHLDKPQISLTSSYDAKLVDLWGEIGSNVSLPGNVSGYAYGTSVSAQVIASKYVYIKMAKPTLTSSQIISLMKSSSAPIDNTFGQKVYLFNLSKAING